MPGIVGLVHRDEAPILLSESIKKLMHLPSYFSQEIRVRNGIQLGQVWRKKNNQSEKWHYDEASKVGVLLNGTMLLSSPHPHRLTPPELLESYKQNGFSHWHNYDGAFVAVIVDLRKRKISIGNDRLGMLPLYFSQTKDMFCFGPEVKAVLTALKKAAKFSRAGMISFLSIGYCLGDTTLFENVQFLKPGSLLTLNLDTFRLERTQLWKLQYEPSREFENKRIAREALYESIKEGHKLILSDNPRCFDLLLSGGLDSRGILGTLDQLKQPPSRALCWGLREDLPYSDARIAHLIADSFNVPFKFQSYTSDDLPQNFETWCYLSELANDNFGWYAEGIGTLLQLIDQDTDFTLKGDECWGWGGWCNSEREARSNILSPTLPGALLSIMRPDQVEGWEALYDREILAITKNCIFQNWTDYKDYLYVYGRVARFIFSMGYYKELAIELRRPFLVNGVIEVVRKLPGKFRVHKNLYVNMIKNFLPRTMLCPDKIVNSLPDWQFDIRTKHHLRQHFLELCNVSAVENSILGEIINTHSFSKLLDGFLGGELHPIRRTASLFERTQQAWWPIISSSPLWAKLKRYRHSNDLLPPFYVFPVLSRIALIIQLEKQLSRFSE